MVLDANIPVSYVMKHIRADVVRVLLISISFHLLKLALDFWLAHRRRALQFFGLAVGGAALLNLAAKNLITRPRPALVAVVHPELSFSFPMATPWPRPWVFCCGPPGGVGWPWHWEPPGRWLQAGPACIWACTTPPMCWPAA